MGEILGLDVTIKADKRRITTLIKGWVTDGWLVVVEKLDKSRKLKKFIDVGIPA